MNARLFIGQRLTNLVVFKTSDWTSHQIGRTPDRAMLGNRRRSANPSVASPVFVGQLARGGAGIARVARITDSKKPVRAGI